jgi:hypothetical protein
VMARLMGLATIAPRTLYERMLRQEPIAVYDLNARASWLAARVPGARRLEPESWAADELARKIQIEALALAFAAGVSFALIAPLFSRLRGIRLDEVWTPLVMLVVWGFASWFGARRFRGGDGA